MIDAKERIAFIAIGILLVILVVGICINMSIKIYRNRIRYQFLKEYGLETISSNIGVRRRRTNLEKNYFELEYPYWTYEKNDGTADLRRNDNEIEWQKSSLYVGKYCITSEIPYELMELVRCLRSKNIKIDLCKEEIKKFDSRLKNKEVALEMTTIQAIVERFKDEPTRFEKFCAELYEKMGYISEVTQPTNDGGYDIRISGNDYTAIVECKCYAMENKIGRPMLQKLVGANIIQANHMIFITTSDFSENAIAYANIVGIELINGKKLIQLINLYMPFETQEYGVSEEEYQLEIEDMESYVPSDIYEDYFIDKVGCNKIKINKMKVLILLESFVIVFVCVVFTISGMLVYKWKNLHRSVSIDVNEVHVENDVSDKSYDEYLETKEGDATTTISKEYQNILEQIDNYIHDLYMQDFYIQNINKYNLGYEETSGLEEHCRFNSLGCLLFQVGYMLYDIDGNGIDELIIAENITNGLNYMVIYTMDEGEAVCLIGGWPRNRIIILQDGMIYNEGSSGAADSEYSSYQFANNGTELKIVDHYFFTEEGAFYNTDEGKEKLDSRRVDKTDIENFQEKMNSQPALQLKLTSFIEYENLGEINKILNSVEKMSSDLEKQAVDETLDQTQKVEIAEENYKLWDTLLNFIWDKLKQKESSEKMNGLIQEERNWISSKESTIQKIDDEIARNNKACDMTKTRTYELIEYLTE